MQYSDYIGALPVWAKDDAKVTWIKKSQNETLYGIKSFEMIQCEQVCSLKLSAGLKIL
jgi:hypothetical protein